jgi:dephospho-CoA kinase
LAAPTPPEGVSEPLLRPGVIYRVGLTGGLGSGKSTVAARLAKLGIPVLDADAVVHELYRPGGSGARAIAEEFGPQLLDASGAVDRPRLAALAFSDPARVARLNARIHPLVLDFLTHWFAELEARGEPLGVVEATLLLEAGGRGRYETIATLSAPEEMRLARALARAPGASPEALRARMRAQMKDEERERVSDVVLRNDGDLAHLLRETDALAARLGADAEAFRRTK